MNNEESSPLVIYTYRPSRIILRQPALVRHRRRATRSKGILQQWIPVKDLSALVEMTKKNSRDDNNGMQFRRFPACHSDWSEAEQRNLTQIIPPPAGGGIDSAEESLNFLHYSIPKGHKCPLSSSQSSNGTCRYFSSVFLRLQQFVHFFQNSTIRDIYFQN